MLLFLLLLSSFVTSDFVPITLSSREWHIPRTDPVGAKVAQLKLSQESSHLQNNVSYTLEPSYHRDVSKYFRVDGGGNVFLVEDLGSAPSPGFLQVVANASGSSVPSRVEIRVNLQDGTTQKISTPFPFPPPIFSSSTTTTPLDTTATTTPSTTVTINTTTTSPSETSSSSTPLSSTTIVMMVLLALVLLAIAVLVGLVCFRKKSRVLTKAKSNTTTRALSNRYEDPPQQPTPPQEQEPKSKEIPRHKLKFISILGEGCFGQVWLCERDGDILACKTLKESAAEREKKDLLSELEVLKTLEPHQNVVRLVGYCTDEGGPPLVVLEYVKYKLQSYLRSCRGANGDYSNLHSDSSLTSKDLTSFALQVAQGMDFLSKNKIIHRDLAARNVLLHADQVTCKVADFGFARMNEEGMYERKSQDGRVPVRWMSPESLYDSLFTTKSDVWSFGVLMWEIVTLGSTPYPGLSPTQVMRQVKQGFRLEKPEHCKRELYNIMFYCWNAASEERPSFEDLVKFLKQLMEADLDYIQLDLFPEHCYYNLVSDDEKV